MRPSVYKWLACELFSAAVPTGFLFCIAALSRVGPTIAELIGYSTILMIGLSVFLGTFLDLALEGHIKGDWRAILNTVFLCCLTFMAGIGLVADYLKDDVAVVNFWPWLSLQIIVTMGALGVSAVTKSSLK